MHALNYDGIYKNKNTPEYVRSIIKSLKVKTHISLGSILEGMSYSDIESIKASITDFTLLSVKGITSFREYPMAESALILVEILSAAEGLDLISSKSVINRRLSRLLTFACIETTGRDSKGGLKINYQRMTLDPAAKGPKEDPLVTQVGEYQSTFKKIEDMLAFEDVFQGDYVRPSLAPLKPPPAEDASSGLPKTSAWISSLSDQAAKKIAVSPVPPAPPTPLNEEGTELGKWRARLRKP